MACIFSTYLWSRNKLFVIKQAKRNRFFFKAKIRADHIGINRETNGHVDMYYVHLILIAVVAGLCTVCLYEIRKFHSVKLQNNPYLLLSSI